MQRESNVTNLACFSQYVSEANDGSNQVDVIYNDFNKAFDHIDYFHFAEKTTYFWII